VDELELASDGVRDGEGIGIGHAHAAAQGVESDRQLDPFVDEHAGRADARQARARG